MIIKSLVSFTVLALALGMGLTAIPSNAAELRMNEVEHCPELPTGSWYGFDAINRVLIDAQLTIKPGSIFIPGRGYGQFLYTVHETEFGHTYLELIRTSEGQHGWAYLYLKYADFEETKKIANKVADVIQPCILIAYECLNKASVENYIQRANDLPGSGNQATNCGVLQYAREMDQP